MKRRSSRFAGRLAAAHRRRDDARRHRRGVPVLQRQQRAAVRAHLRRQGPGCPTRAACASATTCASAAPASGRVGAEAAHQNPQHRGGQRRRDAEAREAREPLPADTTVIVRDRSALGEKYLRAHARQRRAQSSPPGATLPLSAATPEPVELDQLLNMFDAPTRAAEQTNLAAYGDAFAGRGRQSQRHDLQPRRPRWPTSSRSPARWPPATTHLAALFPALERPPPTSRPLPSSNAQLFVDLDTTFKALAGVAPVDRSAIEGAPPSLRPGDVLAAFVRPFISPADALLHAAGPEHGRAARRRAELRPRAVAAGARNLPAAVALNRG